MEALGALRLGSWEKWGAMGRWWREGGSYERKVVFPQPGSPRRRMLTVGCSSASSIRGGGRRFVAGSFESSRALKYLVAGCMTSSGKVASGNGMGISRLGSDTSVPNDQLSITRYTYEVRYLMRPTTFTRLYRNIIM